MRINAETIVVGQTVALVPYREEHVAPYHAWMSDPWIREMTASEPLSLEEEYAMCRSWAQDEDKLTFIVLELKRIEGIADLIDQRDALASAIANARVSAMVGDVNLFFNDPEGEGDRTVCEVEIMIAEPSARRRGLGSEAVQLMMEYAISHCDPPARRFYCKVGDANVASISMFRDRLGFRVCNHVEAFQETELESVVERGEGEGSNQGERLSHQVLAGVVFAALAEGEAGGLALPQPARQSQPRGDAGERTEEAAALEAGEGGCLVVRPYDQGTDHTAVRELWSNGLLDNTRDAALGYPPTLVEEEEHFVHETLQAGDMVDIRAAYGTLGFWVVVVQDSGGGDGGGGAVVGCVGLRAGAGKGVADIGRFTVARTHRGRGAGRMLLAALEERARAQGFGSVTATTVSLNAPALAAFAACGFTEVYRGRMDGKPAPEWVPFVRFEKALVPGRALDYGAHHGD